MAQVDDAKSSFEREAEGVAGGMSPAGDSHPGHSGSTSPRLIFRKQAIQHSLLAERSSGLISLVPMWAGATTAFWGCFVGLTLVAASCIRLELTVRARGVIRPEDGVRPVLANVSGTAAQVLVNLGDRVAKGTPLVRIQSGGLEAQLAEAGARLGVATNGEVRKRTLAFETVKRQLEWIGQAPGQLQGRAEPSLPFSALLI